MKGSILLLEKDLQKSILAFLKNGLEKESFEAVLMPHSVPSGDGYAYLLIKDKARLDGGSPLPPVMPVQGARAISALTRWGPSKKKILAVMHPCEIRAAIELAKLKQASLDNFVFLSFDCPGVMPLSDYMRNPGEADQAYEEACQKRKIGKMRPVCQTCTEFVAPSSDLHIGLAGADGGKAFLFPVSPQGKQVMEMLNLDMTASSDTWEKEVEKLKKLREEQRKEAHQSLQTRLAGPEGFLATLSSCINCHNCMRVCPVCYCRQCYFDSDAFDLPPENFLARAMKKGSLQLPSDKLLFHLGRMSHMILSCVSCGTCEDACPMGIPVAQVFSLVADSAQRQLNYSPGRSKEEPLPAAVYQEEELWEVEQPYFETYSGTGEKNAPTSENR
jgi:formate dehydrogenase subunit beta